MMLRNVIETLPSLILQSWSAQIATAVALPIIVSYLTTEFTVRRNRQKEQVNKERDWLEKTSSIFQLMIWEFEHIDGGTVVSGRVNGTSLNELGKINDLEYLDDRFLELLSHTSNAPSTIPDEIIEEIQRISFNYANPEPDTPTSTVTIDSVWDDLRNDIETIQSKCSDEADSRSPKTGFSSLLSP